jgi:hypothetical protein
MSTSLDSRREKDSVLQQVGKGSNESFRFNIEMCVMSFKLSTKASAWPPLHTVTNWSLKEERDSNIAEFDRIWYTQ